ncbi:PAS-domain containing protein [Ahrensia marina]|uniref:sensor histidine kinase n=1 Tax=Ahrensia marina TaxID=1514904 RepID=UPI0006B4C2F0|nr:PAS-domain containing protein [Ahrensia marina]
MLGLNQSVVGNVPCLGLAGNEILRLGYSDQILAQIIPKILRVIVETASLELQPKGALYLKNVASDDIKLAGLYNLEWSQIDPSLQLGLEFHLEQNCEAETDRILVPVISDLDQTIGTLVFYKSCAGPYAHSEALAALVREVAFVVCAKLKQECDQPAPQHMLAEQSAKNDDKTILHDSLHELLRTTVDNFPGGICVLSSDLTVIMVNKRLYEILDLPETTFPVGCNFADILRFYARRGEYGQGDVEELAQIRIRHAKQFIEDTFDRETASGLFLEVRTTPLASGGCMVSYLDITARKKAEKELLQHRDRLEGLVTSRTSEVEQQARKLKRLLVRERQVNKQMSQFVATASHELRTPLAIIDGAAQRLARTKSEVTPDFISGKVDRIRGSVSRMVELMESFLAFGRLEQGLLDIKPEALSISDLIRHCVADQLKVRPSHEINLDIDELPSLIMADRSALQQVFNNLLSNAIKYAPNSPEIFLRGWCENNKVYVSVRDQGLGIDADDLPKLFERYFRARSSCGIAGTGIGLNLVQQIVKLHGGAITVQSEIDQGTVFTVELPNFVNAPTRCKIPAIEIA